MFLELGINALKEEHIKCDFIYVTNKDRGDLEIDFTDEDI